MQAYPIEGGWYPRKFEMEGSFLVNGVIDPDGIRDGNSNQIASVTRVSAGLFEVTIADRWAMIQRPVTLQAWTCPADVTPTSATQLGVVEGTYSAITRKFRVLASVGATATDPEDNTRVCFRITGSMSPVGLD